MKRELNNINEILRVYNKYRYELRYRPISKLGSYNPIRLAQYDERLNVNKNILIDYYLKLDIEYVLKYLKIETNILNNKMKSAYQNQDYENAKKYQNKKNEIDLILDFLNFMKNL
jgi:hypothetical protein